ncbi:ankyrin repeat domain-containing protein [Ralstonia pseudosolanacearum]
MSEIEEEMDYHQEEGNLGAVMDLVDELGNMGDRLTLAISNGDLDGVLYFASLGFDIREPFYLRIAAKYGQCKLIDYLVRHGSDIHAENDDALFTAAVEKQLGAVRCLVSLGANVHALDERTIKVAAENDFLDIAQYLAGEGASVEAVLSVKGLSDYHAEVYEWAIAYKQAKDLRDSLDENLDDGSEPAPLRNKV